MSHGAKDLEAWVDQVTAWGGRMSSPQRRTLMEQLAASQLGQRVKLFTSRPSGEVFPDSVLLADVSLSAPVPMDVAFNYFEMQKPVNPPAASSLDQGDGFVRLTWGTPGTFQHTAEIDGNRGWRRQFVASLMRVFYIPSDPRGVRPLRSDQDRDLIVSAMVTPASGARSDLVTKTVQFLNSSGGAVGVGTIPRWARTWRLAGAMNDLAGDWDMRMFDSDLVAVGHAGSDGNQAPYLLSIASEYPVPQRAQTFTLRIGGADSIIGPAIIFGLSL